MTKPHNINSHDVGQTAPNQGAPTEQVHLESNPVARKALLLITLAVAVFLGYLLYTLK